MESEELPETNLTSGVNAVMNEDHSSSLQGLSPTKLHQQQLGDPSMGPVLRQDSCITTTRTAVGPVETQEWPIMERI